eukprot:1543537-Prymnesium_polylepis.2
MSRTSEEGIAVFLASVHAAGACGFCTGPQGSAAHTSSNRVTVAGEAMFTPSMQTGAVASTVARNDFHFCSRTREGMRGPVASRVARRSR